MRWLNGSYSIKFNRPHGCCRTVLQGRFKSVLIQEESKVVEVAREAGMKYQAGAQGVKRFA
jgi:hypothetical protein